ncbi:hypothetical protein CYMTET_21961 [Cymbomonas tetramitiformis]|uniref:Uncharacterized protein n=1 Tax=Cymbomonas tetramitiformis TaxID=36881 RepID=A0AAE0G0W6_9CHLO|nr:hypothetical protein CYMTET_21961 [Cymbomonas tetramitiformis]
MHAWRDTPNECSHLYNGVERGTSRVQSESNNEVETATSGSNDMEVDARNPRSEDIYDLNKQFDKDEGKIELDKFVNEAERVHEKTERHLIQDLDMELKNSISNGFQSDLFSSQPTDTALNEKLRSHWNSVRCSAWEMCAATIGVLGSYIGVGEAFTGASQLYQAGMHHRRDILQNRLYHRQAYAQADRHHKEGLNFETEIYKQNWRWHKESIIWGMNEAEAHLRQVINDMREAHKEADRDLFDQHNMQLQSLSTVSTLLLASGFALVVEGRLPAHPGTLLDVDPEYVVIAYYASLGIAIVFMSTSLLCGIWLGDEMSTFMRKQTKQQQGQLKDLRRAAHDWNEALMNMHLDAGAEAGAASDLRRAPQDCEAGAASDLRRAPQDCEAPATSAPGTQGRAALDRSASRFEASAVGMEKLGEMKTKQKEFSEKLWEQTYIERKPSRFRPARMMATGECMFEHQSSYFPKLVTSFQRWFELECRLLDWMIKLAFVLGTFMIMQALVFYVIAHLCGDEPDTGEAQSVTAALVFCSALALFLVMLCLMFAIKMLFPRNPEPKNPFNVMKVLKNAEKLFGNFHKLSLVIQNQHGTQETGVKMSVFAAVLGIGQNGAAGGNSEAAAAEGTCFVRHILGTLYGMF